VKRRIEPFLPGIQIISAKVIMVALNLIEVEKRIFASQEKTIKPSEGVS